MNKDIDQFPVNIQGRIKKAGGLEAYRKQLSEQGARGGRKSTYQRTPEQKAAQSERMRRIWEQRKSVN